MGIRILDKRNRIIVASIISLPPIIIHRKANANTSHFIQFKFYPTWTKQVSAQTSFLFLRGALLHNSKYGGGGINIGRAGERALLTLLTASGAPHCLPIKARGPRVFRCPPPCVFQRAQTVVETPGPNCKLADGVCVYCSYVSSFL